MGWKGTVIITRQEAVDILTNIRWKDVSDKDLQDTLEVIHFIGDHVIIENPIQVEEAHDYFNNDNYDDWGT
jgi:hypothetical protein